MSLAHLRDNAVYAVIILLNPKTPSNSTVDMNLSLFLTSHPQIINSTIHYLVLHNNSQIALTTSLYNFLGDSTQAATTPAKEPDICQAESTQTSCNDIRVGRGNKGARARGE